MPCPAKSQHEPSCEKVESLTISEQASACRRSILLTSANGFVLALIGFFFTLLCFRFHRCFDPKTATCFVGACTQLVI